MRAFGSFGSAIFRRFAGGGPSLPDMTAEERSSGQGEPVNDDSCDRGGDGYALCIDDSGGGDGDDAGGLSGELGTLERSLLLSSKDMTAVDRSKRKETLRQKSGVESTNSRQKLLVHPDK